LPDTTDDISHSDSKLDHGPAIVKASVSTVNIIIIICIAVFWALVALASFRGGREHCIRAMGYICVFTLVAAAAPIVLRQAGGIEADVGGPLWVFWTGAYLNFVLRGALLVRHDQAGYLSPLFYIGTVAVSLSLVFVTADPQSSRLYTTLVALSITILHDVGLRAWFGGLHIQATRLPAHRSDSTSGTLH
jgi:hypothetical protein